MTETDPNAAEIAAYEFSDDGTPEPGEVELDGKPLMILGPVQVEELGVWEPKFVIGDPKINDDKFFSVWNQNNWLGGGQVETINVSSDLNRYRTSTLDNEHPDMLTLPLAAKGYTVASPNGTVVPIADYEVSGTIRMHAAWGSDLYYFDPGADEWTAAADNLSAAPYGAMKGIVYDDELYVPLGSSGYDTFDGATVTNHTDTTPVAFTEWDNKLISLSVDGQIGVWDGASWDFPVDMKLRGNRVPRNLVVWWTPERRPAVFVVTNRDVWACDFINDVLYRTGLRFPVHPDFGLGSAAWQDDSMYVSVGVGVHQLSMGGVITGMGPDRDSGLPAEFRGAIVDLEPEYNGMLALVKGIGETSVDDSTVDETLEETMGFDEALIAPEAASLARSTMLRWTGHGWFTIWESEGATGDPSKVLVSEADGDYRLWWGYGDTILTIPLRRTFYNPKQGAQLGIDRFATSGRMETGRFDAGMVMFTKLASHFEFYLDPHSGGSVSIYYRTDALPDWTLLYESSTTGLNVVLFDPNGDGWGEGLAFKWIEFAYDYAAPEATTDCGYAVVTPIVTWFSLKFIKVPIHTKSWRFTVNLNFPEKFKDRDAREIRDHLVSLASGVIFPTFKHLGEVHRVRVAGFNGGEATSVDYRGALIVNLIGLDVGQ